MQVASLELCRELYELSGWASKTSELDHIWGIDERGDAAVITSQEYSRGKVKIGIPTKLIPAYDLGYLLRKLPGETVITKIENEWYIAKHYHTRGKAPKEMTADTPEDASCQLAIELFKKGILTKEND